VMMALSALPRSCCSTSVPQRNRGAGACRRLAKVMAELGWMAVRVRGLTRGGYLEQVRGYCRDGKFTRRRVARDGLNIRSAPARERPAPARGTA
jgi:hypothetical protein